MRSAKTRRRPALFVVVLFCLIWISAWPSWAQNLAPAGDDMQVNGYTTGLQFFAAIEAEADGQFVVVWTSSDSTYGPDFSGYKIEGQVFDSDSQPLGFEFQANTYVTGDQAAPDITSLGEDSFLVVWQSAGSSGMDASASSILAQRMSFDSAGTVSKNGGEFEINDFTTSAQVNPSLASRTDQGFVVTWESYSSPSSDTLGSSVQARRFTSDGTPQGSQFQVNTYTYSYQRFPDVAVGPNNDFVVVWESYGSDGGAFETTSIRGQRFASDGSTVGGEFQVNTYTLGVAVNEYWYPTVAMNANGDFLVVWGSIGSAGDDNLPEDYSIQGRLFASDGTPQGSQFQVNSYTTGNQREPRVSGTRPAGDFLVTWQSAGSNADNSGSIRGQHYDSQGNVLGGPFQLNTYTTGEQRSAVHGVRPDGELVVVWESYGSPGSDNDLSTLLFRSILTDTDDDGRADVEDNCPLDANPGQEDDDEDGLGNPCDSCFGNNDSGNGDGDGFCADTDCNDGDAGASVVDVCGVCGGDGSTCVLFIDGFEVGDASQWDASVP